MAADQVDAYIYRYTTMAKRMNRDEMLGVSTPTSFYVMESNIPIFGVSTMAMHTIDKNSKNKTHDLGQFSPGHMREWQEARNILIPLALSFDELAATSESRRDYYMRIHAIDTAFIVWYYTDNKDIVEL